MRNASPTDLSDAEWKYIEPHVPAPKGQELPRIHSLPEILDAIFYTLKSGCQWRLLPHDFPPWPTRLLILQKMAHRWNLGEDQLGSIRERLRVRLKRNPQPRAST